LLLTPSGESSARALGRGLGYASVLLLLLTLAISPWMAFRGRRMPVSSMLRRDLGIWTGLTAALHALLGWAFAPDLAVRRAFEAPDHPVAQWALLTGDRRLGLFVALLLATLLVLSNNRAIRLLGPKAWKALQRLVYPLVALVVAHVLGHQTLDERSVDWGIILLGLTAAVLGCRILCRLRGLPSSPLPSRVPLGDRIVSR
jgi:DMSO/TMAO reductase YedYZ heme-binding membrane subunit